MTGKAPKRWEGLALQDIEDKQIYIVKEGNYDDDEDDDIV
jgi:hypothetical protein